MRRVQRQKAAIYEEKGVNEEREERGVNEATKLAIQRETRMRLDLET